MGRIAAAECGDVHHPRARADSDGGVVFECRLVLHACLLRGRFGDLKTGRVVKEGWSEGWAWIRGENNYSKHCVFFNQGRVSLRWNVRVGSPAKMEIYMQKGKGRFERADRQL